MKKYITLSYQDNSQGRKQMQTSIERMSKEGWEVKNSNSASQGYNAVKTVALGALFLPAALLGRKANKIELIMEKEVSESDIKKQKDIEEFMSNGKKIIPFNDDGSVNCPSCKTKIKEYKERWGLFSKTRIFTCPTCGHIVQK